MTALVAVPLAAARNMGAVHGFVHLEGALPGGSVPVQPSTVAKQRASFVVSVSPYNARL